jgi:WXG100 family type VII secretion target
MPRIVADFAALAAFEEAAKKAEQELIEILADLDRDLAPMEAQWSGAARTAYAVVRADWFTGAAQIHEAIGALHRYIATARGNYQRALATNVGIWRR